MKYRGSWKILRASIFRFRIQRELQTTPLTGSILMDVGTGQWRVGPPQSSIYVSQFKAASGEFSVPIGALNSHSLKSVNFSMSENSGGLNNNPC